MNRSDCLTEASKCVLADRNQDYGSPEDNFRDIATLWNTYLGQEIIQTHDVAVMSLLIKVARLRTSPEKLDHWVDIAGYAACGAEVAPESTPLTPPEKTPTESLAHTERSARKIPLQIKKSFMKDLMEDPQGYCIDFGTLPDGSEITLTLEDDLSPEIQESPEKPPEAEVNCEKCLDSGRISAVSHSKWVTFPSKIRPRHLVPCDECRPYAPLPGDSKFIPEE